MDLLPILATLKRHKTAAGLIVLQIALTCAIVCNALFLIMQRIERIQEPSGLVDRELVMLNIAGIGGNAGATQQTKQDLQALNALAGVKSAAIVSQIPFGDSMSATSIRLTPDEKARGFDPSRYDVSEGWLKTLGVNLVAGRDFESGEYQNQLDLEQQAEPQVPAVIINQALAQQLFPTGNAVGQLVYAFGAKPTRVVGVMQTLASPQPGGKEEMMRFTMVLPIRPSYRGGFYMLRTEPQQREAVIKAAASSLQNSGGTRIIVQQRLLEDMRTSYYAQDRSMVMLLAAVCLALLIVTAFGIVGLASFWVQQRTRMIGTRRALGATQGQILRYFQTENVILSTLGIALGMIAAYGISLLLMKSYELPPLPLMFLPIGAVVLWGLGQLAVWAPARRAAALAPVAALRGA